MLIPAIFLGSLMPVQSATSLPLRATLSPVLDTYIDPAAPNTNFGREPSLVLGSGRAVLVDFPELMWARYSGKKLKSAKLVFNLSRGNSNIPLNVSIIKKRWFEGQNRSYRFDKPDPSFVPWGSATWNNAQTGRDGLKWTDSGAKAATDATPIEGLSAEVIGRELIVSGLTETVQSRLDNPFANYGLRIDSSADIAFFSGEWTQERPRLDLEWEESSTAGGDLALMSIISSSEPGSLTAIIKNVGTSQIDSARLEYSSRNGEYQTISVNGSVAPGTTKSVSIPSPGNGDQSDPRKTVLYARVISDADVNLGNNSLEVFVSGSTVAFEADADHLASLKSISPNGEPLLLYQQIVARLNHFVLPFSRFIMAPEGALVRLNLALDPLTADYRVDLNELPEFTSESVTRASIRSLIPLGQSWRNPPSDSAPWITQSGNNLSWLPDTRDDGLRIPGLELPALGFENADNPVPLWNNGLISRVEVAYLQSTLGKKPTERKFPWDLIKSGILIRALGANGENLINTEIALYRPGSTSPIATVNSAGAAFAFFSNEQLGNAPLFSDLANGANSWLIVKASRNGATASTWLPAWQVLDWSVRGNASMPNVELRFNLPSQALDNEQELAKERIVTDSAKRFPAQLATLVDGDSETMIELASNQWIEVDLGRDRIVGQIDFILSGGNYPNLEIFSYGTSQNADAAIRWIGLPNLNFLAKLYGMKVGNATSIPIIHTATRMRYVRIINRGDDPAVFADLRVIPVKVQP